MRISKLFENVNNCELSEHELGTPMRPFDIQGKCREKFNEMERAYQLIDKFMTEYDNDSYMRKLLEEETGLDDEQIVCVGVIRNYKFNNNSTKLTVDFSIYYTEDFESTDLESVDISVNLHI